MQLLIVSTSVTTKQNIQTFPNSTVTIKYIKIIYTFLKIEVNSINCDILKNNNY